MPVYRSLLRVYTEYTKKNPLCQANTQAEERCQCQRLHLHVDFLLRLSSVWVGYTVWMFQDCFEFFFFLMPVKTTSLKMTSNANLKCMHI